MNNQKLKAKDIIKDVLIVLVYLALIIWDIMSDFKTQYSAGVIINHIIVTTLGFVGFVEVSYAVNWTVFVPTFYEYCVNKKQREIIQEGCKFAFKEAVNLINFDEICRKTVQECFEEKIDSIEHYINEKQWETVQNCFDRYFNNEICFIKEYSEDRIQYIMAQLGVTQKQFDKLQYDLIKMRGIPIKSYDDAQEKIKSTLKCGYPIVVMQNSISASNLSYDKVKYFINYNILAFDRKNVRELASILTFLISDKSNIKEIDKIVVPYDSNFLLGLEVGKILNIPVVKMRKEDGRIEKDKPWDGDLRNTDKVIIIHDVMVTGEQIKDAIDKLPDTCEKLGLYCLIDRREYDGKSVVEAKGVTVYSVIELSDDEIREIRGE